MAYKQIIKLITSVIRSLLIPLSAIVVALAIGSILISIMGNDPAKAFSALVKGSFGSKASVGVTIVKMTPIILTGLSFAVAKRCGQLNIGAEGQLYTGGICATAVGIYVTGLPPILHIALCFISGFFGGAIIGLLVGWLKVRFGASELITTIMFNYIAIYLANYMASVGMVEPPGSLPQTSQVAKTAQLPLIWEGTRVTGGIFIAIACLIFFYAFLWHTRMGFKTRVVGLNTSAASYAGIDAKRNILMVMFLAGGFAGLAGVIEIIGVQIRMYQNFSPGYGFDGISVALLGQNTPIGILLSALMFGALRAGSNMMQVLAHVPSAIIYIIQALVIIFVIGSQSLIDFWKKYSLKFQAKGI